MPVDLRKGRGMTTGSLLYGAALVAVFYFLIIRPQQTRAKETRTIQAALSEGDRVVTVGGLHGTVVRVLDSTVILRVFDNAELEFEKLAIAKITVDIPAFPADVEYADEIVVHQDSDKPADDEANDPT